MSMAEQTTRVPLIAGNWKMNLDHLEAVTLVQRLTWLLTDADHDQEAVEVAVFPPFTDLRSVQTLVAGDRLVIGDVTASVWWPARAVPGGSAANNASIVLHVRVGGTDGPGDIDGAGGLSALLLGDIEREAGHAILLALRRDPAMAAAADDLDVVKMPHHGSSNLDEDLMDAVVAPTAVISVGADNTYGHPTPTALQWAARHGTRVVRTDEHGDPVYGARDEANLDKMAAIGIRVRRWVSFHGLAVNVEPDLSHYAGIVPCGIRGHGVTSLVDLGLPVGIEDLDAALRVTFPRHFAG